MSVYGLSTLEPGGKVHKLLKLKEIKSEGRKKRAGLLNYYYIYLIDYILPQNSADSGE